MATEYPSSHKPWLFEDYRLRLHKMAERGGKRDQEVEAALSVLTPRELDTVYYVLYDMISVSATARIMGISRSAADRYYQSALRKVRGVLEPPPVLGTEEIEQLIATVFG